MYKKRGLRFEYITLLLVLSCFLVLYIVNATTYTVGSGADYNDISACLYFINGTTGSCAITGNNVIFNMSSSIVWLGNDLDLYNKTGMVVGYNFSDNGGN